MSDETDSFATSEPTGMDNPPPLQLKLNQANIDTDSKSSPLVLSPPNQVLFENSPSPRHTRMSSRILPISTEIPQLQPEEDVVNVFDQDRYTPSMEESHYSTHSEPEGSSVLEHNYPPRSPSFNHSLASNEEQMLYYPAPIPQLLIKPPILSKNHTKTSIALKRYQLPNKPKWGASPLEAEYWNPQSADDDESDVDSDMATVSGSDSEFEQEEEDPLDAMGPLDDTPSKTKRPNILARMFKLKGDDPDYQNMDDQPQRLAQDEDDVDATLAFSRMDMATVAKHAEMFNIGGVTNNKLIRPSGEAPSLIEEIEIRKSGRKLQRSILARDANRLDIIREDNPSGHPMSQFQLPTLLQLQQLADSEYKGRDDWLKKAIVGQKTSTIEEDADRDLKNALNGKEESLAQRRRRMKLAKETLAERRARLKREKQKAVEVPLEAPLEKAGETPNDSPYEVPNDSPYEAPHDSPYEAPYDVPYEASYEAPIDAPFEVPLEHPVNSPLRQVAESTQLDSNQLVDNDAQQQPQSDLVDSTEGQEMGNPVHEIDNSKDSRTVHTEPVFV